MTYWTILGKMLEDREIRNDKIGAMLRDSYDAIDAERVKTLELLRQILEDCYSNPKATLCPRHGTKARIE